MTQPTFLRVGIPKSKTRAIGTVRPPTETGLASPSTDFECNADNATTSTPAWDLPIANAVSGDLLAAYITVGTSNTLTTPTGWTLADSQSDGGTYNGYLIYRTVDGTEVASTTFTTSAAAPTIAQTWLIESNGQTINAPTVAMSFTASNGTPNPPAISPTAGTYLVYAGASVNTTGWAVSDAPTGYTHLDTCTVSTVVESSVTYHTVEISTSEDPSAFGNSVSATRRTIQWTMGFELGTGSAALATGDHTHTEIDVTDLTHHVVLDKFGEDNLAASLTDSQLYRPVQATQQQIPIVMPYAGSVLGISVASSEARTAGSATFEVFKNGTGTGLTTVLDATDTQYAYNTQAADSDTFAAGDRLDVRVTTDGTWAPTTADVEAAIYVD